MCLSKHQPQSASLVLACNFQRPLQQLLCIDMGRCCWIYVLPSKGLSLKYESTALLCTLQHLTPQQPNGSRCCIITQASLKDLLLTCPFLVGIQNFQSLMTLRISLPPFFLTRSRRARGVYTTGLCVESLTKSSRKSDGVAT